MNRHCRSVFLPLVTIALIALAVAQLAAKDPKLALPHSCKLSFTIEAPNGSFLADWTIAAEQISHNVTLEPKLFAFP